MASFGRFGEVFFSRECHEIFELANEHNGF
jgi:hypothetical protein